MINDTEQELQHLVQQIKKLPPDSNQHRKVLNQLLVLISPELIKLLPRLSERYIKEHEHLCADALEKTIRDISKTIQKYEPTKGTLVNWVKGAFKLNLRNLSRDLRNKQMSSLDDINLEIPAPMEEDNLLREFIEQDTSTLLNKRLNYNNKHTGDEESILLKDVWLMRLDGYTNQDICNQFDISPKSLSSFIKRNGEKVIDYLRENDLLS
ncbi:hypothetical protein DSM106972_027010 [Dulcicalothrix desertica PCC 7102]|uniref:Uncharacterized protein n=1 Tax=Dulcicalothrix desertica PCC 7102 TaxID=232991 RepID=A0A3S1B7G1_9CYAN|nr:hypothetical protein [Dulcicalothrix desertica]RUT06444.1 hypothetical protein DSM106972_027010 [Dulcicalothrix desertica PCC 7102]TWH50412.1 hypothetical protein CAL7102_04714 [Dulcicalothrix desertica PCC 7102]